MNCNTAKKYILDTFDELRETFLDKNADYGDSVFHTGPLCSDVCPSKAVAIRMNDKIKRLATLMQLDNSANCRVNESITDTLKDLAVYAIILASIYNAKEEKDE